MSFKHEISFPLLERSKAFRKKKSLGQNFLISEVFLEKIADALELKEGENITEIACGIGFLTEQLLDLGLNVTALDLDETALKLILPHERLTKIHADALEFDFAACEEPLNIVGNLPFNVGTQIVLRFLGELNQANFAIPQTKQMVIMLQEEVARRLTAKSSTKPYNQISVLAQAKANIEYLFKVPANCFSPIPKVDAAVIKITQKPSEDNPLTSLNQQELDTFKNLTKQAFSLRRKKLNNSLGSFSKAITNQSKHNIKCKELIDKRAENLILDDFIFLTKLYLQETSN